MCCPSGNEGSDMAAGKCRFCSIRGEDVCERCRGILESADEELRGKPSADGGFLLCNTCTGPYVSVKQDTGFCPECERGRAQGKTALRVQAEGGAATVSTSDERIRGNVQDIIMTMRQDLQVISEGRQSGAMRKMRVAELVGRAQRLRQLIDGGK